MSDSIPALVARVQALEARVGDLEGRQMVTNWTSDLVEIAEILRPTNAETLEDAARRVVAERDAAIKEKTELLAEVEDAIVMMDGYRNLPLKHAVQVVVAARNNAGRDRDEAVRTLHRMVGTEYGARLVSPGDRTSVHDALRFLARHGLATDHGDGTYTLQEPKP